MGNFLIEHINNTLDLNELKMIIRDQELEIRDLKKRAGLLTEERIRKASRAHTVYKLSDGKTRVPGATTICGLLNKPYLVKWANNLGLEGISSTDYTDEAANIGTLAHAMVQADLQGTELNMNQYSPDQVDQAENALISFFEWKKHHELMPIRCEAKLVSDQYRYGGTIDCYCMLDGRPTLLDFKTGKAIYEDYFLQLAAYKNLLEELKLPVEEVRILRIGRQENEGFEDRLVDNTEKYFEIFKHLLEVYYLKRELGWK